MKAVVVLKEIKRCGGRSPLGRLQPGLSRTRLYFNQSSTPRYFQPFQPIWVFLSSSISKSRENTKIASDYHTRLIFKYFENGENTKTNKPIILSTKSWPLNIFNSIQLGKITNKLLTEWVHTWYTLPERTSRRLWPLETSSQSIAVTTSIGGAYGWE